MDLSIVIVHYTTPDLTLQTLASVFAAQKPAGGMEVILVDNASADDTPKLVRQRFPQVKVIASSKNLGFAGGNNLGMKQATGRYVLLLNSDTLVAKNTFTKMIKFMDQNSKVGLATCKVKLFSGGIDPASHRGFPTPWAALTYYSGLEKIWPKSKLFGQYHQGWKNLTTTHEIDTPVGAFFFIRLKALKQAGYLDEAFFMYGEDIDLAFRIKASGWQIIYTPITSITHLKGASGLNKKVKDKLTAEAKAIRIRTVTNFFEAMKLFYKKHYQKEYPWLLQWLVWWGIDLLKIIRITAIRLK